MARSRSGRASHPDPTSEQAGRRTRVGREEIAAAAVRIADEEGFDALSMRRLAGELDVGTMTLYHYIRGKDDLLAIVNDAVMGELIVPDGELPDDWREALMAIARRSRDVIQRHPWSLDLRDDPTPGPNGTRHYDQTMQAVLPLGLPLPQLFELVSAVDEYVFGHCIVERANYFDQQSTDGDVIDYMSHLVATGDYPALAVIVERCGVDGVIGTLTGLARDSQRFERNLGRLLDGFAADYGLP